MASANYSAWASREICKTPETLNPPTRTAHLLYETFLTYKPVHPHSIAVHLGYNTELTPRNSGRVERFLFARLTKLRIKYLQRINGHSSDLNVAKFVIVRQQPLFPPVVLNTLA
jgi:hypothetical protein